MEMSVIVTHKSQHSATTHLRSHHSLLPLLGCFAWLHSTSLRCTLILVIVWFHRLLPFRQKPGFLSILGGIITIVFIDVRPFYRHVQFWRRRLLLSSVGLWGWNAVGLPDFEFLWRLLSKHIKKPCDEPRVPRWIRAHAPPCRLLIFLADFFKKIL